MDTADIVTRLGLAALAGAALGLNRDLHGKPTGVRTLGLVGLASALIVIAVGHGEGDVSRVMQGIVTGIGFLGAGVIIRSEKGKHVHNLTTAAGVWLTACIGAGHRTAALRMTPSGDGHDRRARARSAPGSNPRAAAAPIATSRNR